MLIDVCLPIPKEFERSEVIGKLGELTTVHYEPVGRWYEAYCTRRQHKHTLSTSSQSSSSEEEEDDLDEFEDDDNILLTLDPREWKKQDHYAVLGLGKLRYKATDDQIKRAYKKKVLQHHPDKRRAAGIPVKQGEEDYFTCVTRAYEVLGVPSKRRSYDSVDPTFDDHIPPNNNESKQNFFKVFGPVFQRNIRWSTKTKKVLTLGDEETPFDQVDDFYNFWYNFESWREYSYLDEEEKEKGENREERRWIEKQNKAVRLKLKKEETQRIRQLVDNAYACDPRVIKYKTEERERKMADKKAKQDAIRMKLEEEERKRQEVLEVERLAREKEEEELKMQMAVQKREKEALKKNLKKERKLLRTFIKDWEYLSNDEKERVRNMQDLDRIAELSTVETLTHLNEVASSGGKEKFAEEFFKKVKELNERIDEEKRQQAMEMMNRKQQQASTADKSANASSWSDVEVQTLIKAVNLFPAGTNARWETIANFLKLHVPGSNRNAKETLARAKELQKNDSNLKDEANKKAYENFKRDTHGAASVVVSQVSERYESPAEMQVYEVGSNPAPWTADEQKLLEQAMRTYPASEADRWDKIAECIPARSKKDCMKRYKELVELIRTKKLAQATTASTKKK
ncbi:hypothetical protein HELRODRAFT_193411 [Helobdella robusta]|uniref:Uncharacterized protein n=1 Tax=Helobdella robusta TaxID=6412 RepID=T1FUY9_HELRO|nr:hypothetical protein HELRODRAFT_193411 [Helobdella robusta]ESN96960.1 hypothetical protein HELRODRAFT_193411 [Helobdella robusta]